MDRMKSYLEFERDTKILEEELEKLKDPYNKKSIVSYTHGNNNYSAKLLILKVIIHDYQDNQ